MKYETYTETDTERALFAAHDKTPKSRIAHNSATNRFRERERDRERKRINRNTTMVKITIQKKY